MIRNMLEFFAVILFTIAIFYAPKLIQILGAI